MLKVFHLFHPIHGVIRKPERQTTKTFARQMYPGDSSNFIEKFKKATSKSYGKLLLDLRPNILEKDQFVTEDDYDNDKKVYQNPFTTNKTSPPMTQMYSQKLKQHKRDRLQYEKRNTVRAMDIKSEIDELMNNKSVPENAKSNRCSDLLQE